MSEKNYQQLKYFVYEHDHFLFHYEIVYLNKEHVFSSIILKNTDTAQSK